MTQFAAEPGDMAIVCGSDTAVGGAVASRLRHAGLEVATINLEGASPQPSATLSLSGDLGQESTWIDFQAQLRGSGKRPRMLVHAIDRHEESANPFDLSLHDWDAVIGRNLRSAFLACRHLMPLLDGPDAAVVLVGSVLAYWDTRSDLAFGTSQAGLLGLMRSLTLAGASSNVRVNAVCAGLVAKRRNGTDAIPPEITGRIPLGRVAEPDDVARPILFLLSPDASHISGSTLVVDGGQSLQSWSNTPHEGHYPTPLPVPSPRSRDASRRFDGQTVLITGAAGGMGSAAVRRFGSEGANIVLLDRNGPGAEDLAHELSEQGIQALALEVDVADERAMKVAFATSEQHFGQLDVIFNNAGIGSSDMTVLDIPIEHWDEVQAINLRGIFLGSRYGTEALRRAGGGAIVNMGSSTARHDTITGGAAYMASKAAVEALTRSLAIQVAQYGIRANTIAPGVVETELSFRQQAGVDPDRFKKFAARIPLRRVGQPEDVAATVAFLASDDARHVTGATLLIDGGQTLTRWVSAPDLGPNLP